MRSMLKPLTGALAMILRLAVGRRTDSSDDRPAWTAGSAPGPWLVRVAGPSGVSFDIGPCWARGLAAFLSWPKRAKPGGGFFFPSRQGEWRAAWTDAGDVVFRHLPTDIGDILPGGSARLLVDRMWRTLQNRPMSLDTDASAFASVVTNLAESARPDGALDTNLRPYLSALFCFRKSLVGRGWFYVTRSCSKCSKPFEMPSGSEYRLQTICGSCTRRQLDAEQRRTESWLWSGSPRNGYALQRLPDAKIALINGASVDILAVDAQGRG